jgi:murein L,D-transpeptidase YafK
MRRLFERTSGLLQATGSTLAAAAVACRHALALAPLLILGMVHAPSARSYDVVEVDQVRVIKHERKLYLLNGDRIVRSYDISLGQNPEGHKLHSGDNRTPEGRYELDWRNANSRFHRSLHISYPGPDDIAWAQARGLDPGQHIMIHGLPNGADDNGVIFHGVDWTDGCVAVNDNSQMDEIWSLVTDGTPIYILP